MAEEESDHIQLLRKLADDMTALCDGLGLTDEERAYAGLMSSSLLTYATNMWHEATDKGVKLSPRVKSAALAMATGHCGLADRMRQDNKKK